MSLSSSLSNAVTGLTAAARGAEIVSSNVSNATTEGYGTRRLELSSRSNGPSGTGVQVVGVTRDIDIRVIADRRMAEAQFENSDIQLSFQSSVEELIGIPGSAGSLSARLSSFEADLISSASRPDVDSRLSQATSSAKSLAQKFNEISDGIQDLRQNADRAISAEIETLNTALQQIQTIGIEINQRIAMGYDPSSQFDQRQILIDQVSEIVPVKEIDRGNGRIALISPGGGILFDGNAAEFGFDPVGVITPDMTRAAGSLSGITINGVGINLNNSTNAISGGRLAALFSVRDDLAVTEQSRLDHLAEDLVGRFQDASVDPTLAVVDAGLFTDGGSAFSSTAPAYAEGLSARLSVNAAVDPEEGGAVWRLRDGLNAASQGAVGNATILQNFVEVLQDPRSLAGDGYSGTDRSASDLGAEFLSLVSGTRKNFETSSSYSAASVLALKELELQGGVDTDHEMQQLLLVEAAYNANARVIQVVEELLDRLMQL